MSKVIETSLIIKKETIYDKMRNALFLFINRKDYQMIQRFDELIKPKRPNPNSKIIIPREIGKNFTKY